MDEQEKAQAVARALRVQAEIDALTRAVDSLMEPVFRDAMARLAKMPDEGFSEAARALREEIDKWPRCGHYFQAQTHLQWMNDA